MINEIGVYIICIYSVLFENLEIKMSDDSQDVDNIDRTTVFGSMGIAVFLIGAAASYWAPGFFPSGSLFALAGVLILLVSVTKIIAGIGCSVLSILFGVSFTIIGINRVFELDLGIVPGIVIVLASVLLLHSINRLRKGQIFD